MKALIQITTPFEDVWLLGEEEVIDEMMNGFNALKQALENGLVSYTQFEDTVYKIKNEYDVEVIRKGYQILL